MGDVSELDKKKGHRERHSGRKAEKKSAKNKHVQDLTAQQRNPKAFAFHSAVKAQRQFVRSQDIKVKKHHIPVVDRTPVELPPVIVAVVGGPKVGKSTLLRCLIKNYTRQKLTSINGPVTVIAGKKKKLTFIEVNNDVNCMIDIAKVADIVLMLIDATFGIEMEVFEFLEICRAHGSPRIMGLLNHLDMLKDNKALKKRKKALKQRFQVELYPGAKLFYLSGIVHGEYLKNEIKNLGRFISVMKFRPLTWRTTHPFVLVDRYEDITNQEVVRTNPKCDRSVVLYGYVRGVPFHQNQTVHIPGCADYKITELSFLPDPCPLPEQLKKRSLNFKERLIYAPMSGVGGVVYDKDAVYIDLGGSHHGKKTQKEDVAMADEGDGLLQPLLDLQKTTDEKREQSHIQVFSHSKMIPNRTIEEENEEGSASGSDGNLPDYEVVEDETGRVRRRAIFHDDIEDEDTDDDDEDDSDDDDGSLDEEEEIEYDNEEEASKDSINEDVEKDSGPPRKKMKTTDESGSDSDDYDIEKDLLSLKSHSLGTADKEKNQNDRYTEGAIKNMATSGKPKVKEAEAEITSKVQGILKKLAATRENNSVKGSTNKVENHAVKPDLDTDSSDDSGDESEEMDESGLGSHFDQTTNEEDEADEEDETSDESEKEDDESRDKYRLEMFKEASRNFYSSQNSVSYLRKYIYGEIEEELEESEDEEEIGGLFKRATAKRNQEQTARAIKDQLDTTRYCPAILRDWSQESARELVRDCFVTGEWKESENAQTLLDMDAEDEDLYGDFEDLETGAKFSAPAKSEKEEGEEQALDEGAAPVVKEEAKTAKEKRLEKKRRLKEMFNSEYDDKGDGDYFESLKNEMSEQAQINKSEFEGLDDETRVQYEGFRPGMYVRMEFANMPCEFVTHFDPSYPVIVGGMLDNEHAMGYIRVRIKVHRWYPKILKNRDPLIFSLGWKRFQSPVFYAKREDNFRLRSLKYARKYLHIEGMFWGPITPVSTGFVALQNITDRVPDFRIAANGVVLETDQSSKIVKKLKLMGAPEKILKKTAFIKDMFHSDIEVAKFEGAKVQTQSGIRGLIKKAKGHQGWFRATFEDTIKMSDVVVLKTWVPVDVIKFSSTLRNLLLPPNEKAQWQGMKTVAQIKKEKGKKNLVNPDTLYTPITERREYIPLPLKVPKELQKALPYRDKPKITPKAKKAERVVVVKDPHEIEMDNFMKRLKLMMEDKIMKEEMSKAEKKAQYKKEIEEREGMRQKREKVKKAVACRFKSKKSSKMKK